MPCRPVVSLGVYCLCTPRTLFVASVVHRGTRAHTHKLFSLCRLDHMAHQKQRTQNGQNKRVHVHTTHTHTHTHRSQNSECFMVQGHKWYDYKHAHTTYTKQLTNNTKQTDKTKRNRTKKPRERESKQTEELGICDLG